MYINDKPDCSNADWKITSFLLVGILSPIEIMKEEIKKSKILFSRSQHRFSTKSFEPRWLFINDYHSKCLRGGKFLTVEASGAAAGKGLMTYLHLSACGCMLYTFIRMSIYTEAHTHIRIDAASCRYAEWARGLSLWPREHREYITISRFMTGSPTDIPRPRLFLPAVPSSRSLGKPRPRPLQSSRRFYIYLYIHVCTTLRYARNLDDNRDESTVHKHFRFFIIHNSLCELYWNVPKISNLFSCL